MILSKQVLFFTTDYASIFKFSQIVKVKHKLLILDRGSIIMNSWANRWFVLLVSGMVVTKLAKFDDLQAAVVLHPGPLTADEINRKFHFSSSTYHL